MIYSKFNHATKFSQGSWRGNFFKKKEKEKTGHWLRLASGSPVGTGTSDVGFFFWGMTSQFCLYRTESDVSHSSKETESHRFFVTDKNNFFSCSRIIHVFITKTRGIHELCTVKGRLIRIILNYWRKLYYMKNDYFTKKMCCNIKLLYLVSIIN